MTTEERIAELEKLCEAACVPYKDGDHGDGRLCNFREATPPAVILWLISEVRRLEQAFNESIVDFDKHLHERNQALEAELKQAREEIVRLHGCIEDEGYYKGIAAIKSAPSPTEEPQP